MLRVAKKYPTLPYDIFNAITSDTQVKSVFKILLPNMLVSSQTCCNRVTNYNDWCGRVLQKILWNVCASCHPSLSKRGTGNLQLLVRLLLVKPWGSLIIVSVCVLYNFLVNKITSLIFFA